MRRALHLLLLLCLLARDSAGQATTEDSLTEEAEVSVASKIYALTEVYSAREMERSGALLDVSYKLYLNSVLTSRERRKFDLATMEFVAGVHNGHTLFLDTWLNERYGQPLGFFAAPFDGRWVVQSSSLTSLKPGDVIAAVDGVPMEGFFERQEKYISASSDRARRHNLFLFPYLFPEEFTLKLEDGRDVVIHRGSIEGKLLGTKGRWLKQPDTAYIRIAAFYPPGEDFALDFLRQYQKAKTLIIDVRNNPGGIPPVRLIRALMDRPYRNWKVAVPLLSPLFDSFEQAGKPKETSPMSDYERGYNDALADLATNKEFTRGGDSVAPSSGAFRGRLILLVDGGCVSACEDFAMPFKDNGRATLVGETTQGSAGVPYTCDFHNGMAVRIAVKRLSFPDGLEFEGIGIKPDIEVRPTIEDLKQGRDAVLQRAVALAEKP